MYRVRAVDAFVMWTLSVLLAGTFLLAGVPKVIGSAPVGFQAAAMHGFPTGIRVIVGLLEVLCAIGLLVPAVATLSAGCLALLMVPAAVTQYISGEPGLWVPLLVFALLGFVAWRRNAKWVFDGYHEFADVTHPLLKEGAIAGLIGATVIAVWFGILDAVRGRPFFTPATLGRGLISVFGAVSPDQGTPTFVLTYTVFHVAAFMIVGLVASLIVQLARKEPSILLGFAILFAVSEVGIYGIVAALGENSALGQHAWLAIMVGNVLAAASMGYYFWLRHRELEFELHHAFDQPEPEPGDEDDQEAVVESEVGVVPLTPPTDAPS